MKELVLCRGDNNYICKVIIFTIFVINILFKYFTNQQIIPIPLTHKMFKTHHITKIKSVYLILQNKTIPILSVSQQTHFNATIHNTVFRSFHKPPTCLHKPPNDTFISTTNLKFFHSTMKLMGKSTNGFGSSTTAEEVIKGIDLTGKTVFITGANTGIGRETARVMAKAGAQVIMGNHRVIYFDI